MGHVTLVAIARATTRVLKFGYESLRLFGGLGGQRLHLDGLVQERRNPIANALELRLSCIKLSICGPQTRYEWLRLVNMAGCWYICSEDSFLVECSITAIQEVITM